MVRLSPRSALNDPFEIRPSIETIANYAKTHSSDSLTNIETEDILNSDYDSFFKKYGGSPIFNNYGVFCLSETRTNLLMWSHYANHHKGIVIGFDVTHPFFNRDYSDNINHHGIEVGRIHRVIYDNYRINNSIDTTGWYLFKSDEWIYEKEHRLILPLNDCDKLVRNDPDGNLLCEIENRDEIINTGNLGHPQHICLFQVPVEAISSITLGAEVEQSKWFGIKNYFSMENNRHKDFKLEKARISANRFELEIS